MMKTSMAAMHPKEYDCSMVAGLRIKASSPINKKSRTGSSAIRAQEAGTMQQWILEPPGGSENHRYIHSQTDYSAVNTLFVGMKWSKTLQPLEKEARRKARLANTNLTS